MILGMESRIQQALLNSLSEKPEVGRRGETQDSFHQAAGGDLKAFFHQPQVSLEKQLLTGCCMREKTSKRIGQTSASCG